MKKGLKISLWTLIVFLGLIQFVPVDRENPESDETMDFLVSTQADEAVQGIMRNSCYDCHSNATIWPWYSYVAPMSILVANHVAEGRDQVNFSDWDSYESGDKIAILKEMKEVIEENEMPLSSYALLHSEAKFTDENKKLILSWIDHLSAE